MKKLATQMYKGVRRNVTKMVAIEYNEDGRGFPGHLTYLSIINQSIS